MRKIALVCLIALSGCVTTTGGRQSSANVRKATLTDEEVSRFVSVIEAVEPVAEQQCRTLTKGINCDFQIAIDERRNQAPNAFQTIDKTGRPYLVFNLPLIETIRSHDELAFIVSHEAAHHIRNHRERTYRDARAGGLLKGALGVLMGGDAGQVADAYSSGADLGSRVYSKDYELEADALGTVITKRARFDPIKGMEYFSLLHDPGNEFLGTHPPHAKRIETVKRVNDGL